MEEDKLNNKIEKEFKLYLQNQGFKYFDLKAVLFDMDGVLYDSMPAHEKSWQHAARYFNLKSEPDEFFIHEGRTGKSTINILFNRTFGRDATDEEIERVYNVKTDYFLQLNSHEEMEGAYDLLNKVKSGGLKPILVTGSGRQNLHNELQENFPDIFTSETMVTAFDVKFGKPHPEPFLMGLKKGGNLAPNQALVIENAPLGVESAHKAGIFTIAVNTGPLADKMLSDAGANMVFSSVEELLKSWENIMEIINGEIY